MPYLGLNRNLELWHDWYDANFVGTSYNLFFFGFGGDANFLNSLFDLFLILQTNAKYKYCHDSITFLYVFYLYWYFPELFCCGDLDS